MADTNHSKFSFMEGPRQKLEDVASNVAERVMPGSGEYLRTPMEEAISGIYKAAVQKIKSMDPREAKEYIKREYIPILAKTMKLLRNDVARNIDTITTPPPFKLYGSALRDAIGEVMTAYSRRR
jgi:hypothetical protein